MLALYAGLRRNEIASLTWGDCSTRDGVAWLRLPATVAKNAKVSDHRIPDFLAYALLEYRRSHCSETSVVIREGVPRVPTLRGDLSRAGILFEDEKSQRVDLHALRHTYITWLAQTGVMLRELQALARHSDIRTTSRYLHPSQDRTHEAIDKLPRLSGEGPVTPRDTSDGHKGPQLVPSCHNQSKRSRETENT